MFSTWQRIRENRDPLESPLSIAGPFRYCTGFFQARTLPYFYYCPLCPGSGRNKSSHRPAFQALTPRPTRCRSRVHRPALPPPPSSAPAQRSASNPLTSSFADRPNFDSPLLARLALSLYPVLACQQRDCLAPWHHSDADANAGAPTVLPGLSCGPGDETVGVPTAARLDERGPGRRPLLRRDARWP